MKKIIVLFIVLIVLSGCTINVKYEFGEKEIKSTIVTKFTLDEYGDYVDLGEEEDIKREDLYDDLIENKKNIAIEAFEDNDLEYNEDYFKEENGSYISSYSYTYDYDNFDNSYILKHCFTSFEKTEDEEFYNYKISGDYLCDDPISLSVTSKNGIDNSNSIDIKDDVHNWYIFEEDNEIVFSIRKYKEVIDNSSSVVRIIGFIVLSLMIGSLFVMNFIHNKQSDESY